MIHLPSFFAELEKTESKGISAKDRLFISDRAHLVFDFHRIVDGIREEELGRGGIGTTKKGIGPTYSSKASRSGLRVHHLFNFEEFEDRFRRIVANRQKRYGNFEYDVEKELETYRELAKKVRPCVVDTIPLVHELISSGKTVLVEGTLALLLLNCPLTLQVQMRSCSISTLVLILLSRLQVLVLVVSAPVSVFRLLKSAM